MAIRELNMLCIVGDKVCLYEETSEEDIVYKDLYQGDLMDVPEELLEKKIRVIGAKRKNIIDVEVY